MEGGTYYLVHKITTPCGEFCDFVEFCKGEDCLTNLSQKSSIDCTLFENPDCEPPSIGCPEGTINGVLLSWSSVNDVDYYQVEIKPANGDCKCGQNVEMILENGQPQFIYSIVPN